MYTCIDCANLCITLRRPRGSVRNLVDRSIKRRSRPCGVACRNFTRCRLPMPGMGLRRSQPRLHQPRQRYSEIAHLSLKINSQAAGQPYQAQPSPKLGRQHACRRPTSHPLRAWNALPTHCFAVDALKKNLKRMRSTGLQGCFVKLVLDTNTQSMPPKMGRARGVDRPGQACRRTD